MVERIKEYVDFADLPPAKGKVWGLPSGLDGSVVLVQAADFVQLKNAVIILWQLWRTVTMDRNQNISPTSLLSLPVEISTYIITFLELACDRMKLQFVS